jgi:2-keto-3-deoxy-L-fuconate dehydrogenase
MELIGMVRSLEGRTTLITAAGQGIGYATALAFADAGAIVIAIDINPKGLENLANERPSISTRQVDVTDSSAISTLVRGLDRVDVLFNCVGYVHDGSILECEECDWKRSFDLNVTSMFRTCRAVLPGMIARKQGSIINVASVVSSIKGAPKRFAYGTSKAAVIGLTKSIAADFVHCGIRCNALCPGTIYTPSLEERMAAGGDLDVARQAFIARQPMGRLGTPQEIAQAALYLASDDSSFMTGQAFVVDGGWSI